MVCKARCFRCVSWALLAAVALAVMETALRRGGGWGAFPVPWVHCGWLCGRHGRTGTLWPLDGLRCAVLDAGCARPCCGCGHAVLRVLEPMHTC